MKSLLALDTLDDRRELWHLLHRLPPRDRIRFLQWACRQAPPGRGKLPVPCVQMMRTTLEQAYRCDRADARLTNEVFGDLLILMSGTWGVDSRKLTEYLEQKVKEYYRTGRIAW